MSGIILDIVELLLTAEIYNRYPELDVNDLPKNIRKNYWNSTERTVPKPIIASFVRIEKLYGIKDIEKSVRNVPFITIDRAHFELRLSAFELAAEWLEKQEGAQERIENNPVLAYYLGEIRKGEASNYAAAKANLRPKEVDREWIESLIADIRKEDKGEEMLKLVVIIAPEDVKQKVKDLVLTEEQKDEIEKIMKAIKHREYLREIGLHDIGKLLFVGPPGTGKTSVARALSEQLSIPFVEVKLSMITDQYLGETAKNIDRVFVAVSPVTPKTEIMIQERYKGEIQVIRTFGGNYVGDMIHAVETAKTAGPVMIIMSDIPLINPELIDSVIEKYKEEGKPALSVYVPINICKGAGIRPDTVFNKEGKLIVPTGVNILDSSQIRNEQEDFNLILDNPKLAINVNTVKDLQRCRDLLQG